LNPVDSDLNFPKVLTIPETPTLIMEMGVNRTEELGLSDKKLLAFQEAVMDIQTRMEDTTMKLARKLASCEENRARDIIIIMDRGTMDCKGYMPEYVWEALLMNKNTTEEAILARYDAVIHIKSVAVENPQLYDELKANNSIRTETRLQAAVQDNKELDSWQGHPARTIIDNNDGNWSDKVLKIKEAIVQALHTRGRTRPPAPPPGFPQLGTNMITVINQTSETGRATPMMAIGFKSAINGKPATVMIDSGAALSIADIQQVTNLGVKVNPFAEGEQLSPITSVSKQTSMPVGRAKIPLKLEGNEKLVTVNCKVFRNISCGIIMGNTDLRQREAILDYERAKATVKADNGTSLTIPVSLGKEQPQFPWPDDLIAEALKKERIPPRTSVIVTAKARLATSGRTPDLNETTFVLVEGNWKLHTLGVLIGRSMSTLEKTNTVKILVINPTDQEAMIPKHKKLADLRVLPDIVASVTEEQQPRHEDDNEDGDNKEEKERSQGFNPTHQTVTDNTTKVSRPENDSSTNFEGYAPTKVTVSEDGWLTTETESPLEIDQEDEKLAEEILSRIDPQLEEANKQQLFHLLMKYKEVFKAPNEIPTRTPLIKHAIQSEGVAYVKQYRMAPDQIQKAEKIVTELEKQGVISESSSNFNAPIVMVKKKTGETRMCLDLRSLNAITTPAKFPLPTPREMFDQLEGAYYFSSLDML